jgi:hypothetical protein
VAKAAPAVFEAALKLVIWLGFRRSCLHLVYQA